jgi:hypothetical protein
MVTEEGHEVVVACFKVLFMNTGYQAAEASVESHKRACGIYGGQSGTTVCLFPSTSVSLFK